MKYKNGTEIKEGDKVVGFDHCNRPCAGIVVKGSPALLQEPFVFQNDSHGAVQSSLSLTKFLRSDDAENLLKAVTDKTVETSAASTAK